LKGLDGELASKITDLNEDQREDFLRELYNRLIDVGADMGESFEIEVGEQTYQVEFKDLDNDGNLDIVINGTNFIELDEYLTNELANNEKLERYEWKGHWTPL